MNRSDGRKIDQLRSITVERNYNKFAEGSCFITMGDTKVVCTASVDKNVPLFLRNSGTGWVTAEYGMLPRSTSNRIYRDKPSGRTMEIRRLISRSLRAVTDLNRLGERTVWVDCDVIQADGGTRIASIIGGFISLVDCLSMLEQQKSIPTLCITDYVGAVSVGIVGKHYLLDLAFDEDSRVDVDMNVVMKGSGEFIEIQGAAEHKSFSHKDLNKVLEIAQKGIDEIISLERNLLQDTLSI